MILIVLPPLPFDQKQGGVRQQTWLVFFLVLLYLCALLGSFA